MGNDKKVAVSHKLCGFLGRVSWRILVRKEPVVVAPKFRPCSLHIFSQVSQSATVKVHRSVRGGANSWSSSRILSTFPVVLFVLGRPEHSSFSTDTRLAFKWECHSKIAVRLKECSPRASRMISRVSTSNRPSFTQA
jgi:hypothetical protein